MMLNFVIGFIIVLMAGLFAIRVLKQLVKAMYGMAPYFMLLLFASAMAVYMGYNGNNARNPESIKNQSTGGRNSEQWVYDQIPIELKPRNQSRKD